MKIKTLVAASCLLAAGVQAQGYNSTPMMYSQPEFYVGLNYAQLQSDIENDAVDRVFSPEWNTVGLNLGVQPSPYLAFELRYGKGVGGDDFSLSDGVNSASGTTKLKHYFGAYALPQFPIQDFMSVYGLLGWTKGKAEIEVTELNNMPVYGKASDSEDDFSYGVGVRFRDMRNPNGIAFFAEYARLINRGDYDINGMMFGLSWHF
ncbi:porin family protein [Oceanimonas sp. CAM02]|uniref:porin family protein n=1 Tax=Oceanimonas TaxID=129577 RepID=UPI00293592FA|nr:porin family protein [Oceanimonas sp. CAM02]MDV2856713.1 porin family protein [Oceanimonas sp. CAM02]